ncbi:hypothetical protein LZ496_09230 [Sphingomonas sp. NSE70-1]|uniref:Uncharacterized protein n=1 Tax=Sphingomonas caseinilyticus TaxID=2908205 RepID=A0ABT0RVE3_9SPHN|nr:hypothetical protein [Sphingomonas caseinilyticus]MCL6698962.1 hypothetical protein [Sphingomonas caseinilyticus]
MNLRTSMLTAVSAAIVLAGTASVLAQQSTNPETTQKLAKALAGRTAGHPVNCINERSKMQIIDDGTILFRDGGIVYVQQPRGGCYGLTTGMSLIRPAYGTTRLCSGDINNIVDVRTGFGAGACVYSEFVPYRKTG